MLLDEAVNLIVAHWNHNGVGVGDYGSDQSQRMVDRLLDARASGDRKEEVFSVVEECLCSSSAMDKETDFISKIERGEAEEERDEQSEDIEDFGQPSLSNPFGGVDMADHDVAIADDGDWYHSIEDHKEEAKGELDAAVDVIIPDACGIDESEASQHPEVSHAVEQDHVVDHGLVLDDLHPEDDDDVDRQDEEGENNQRDDGHVLSIVEVDIPLHLQHL